MLVRHATGILTRVSDNTQKWPRSHESEDLETRLLGFTQKGEIRWVRRKEDLAMMQHLSDVGYCNMS
ncbi:unnamed protein product [Fusarium graminearum]|uniref:Uncharacterized protein n=1 Tax=Gibberella zeae TaxID=5518 RepID=A0A4U9EUF9_GIBZA|nr:unnamed protein product [Fusarium graminearum]CAF3593910.1 unnamed protein product [Fusarium graminearum]CAG1962908.1 unnamed protein product [Fusarium graminearum]CAG2005875.1 unnamed protein product [Fusarium graminearum]VTO84586.1 unnamed protein product [Fusarium graminearum]